MIQTPTASPDEPASNPMLPSTMPCSRPPTDAALICADIHTTRLSLSNNRHQRTMIQSCKQQLRRQLLQQDPTPALLTIGWPSIMHTHFNPMACMCFISTMHVASQFLPVHACKCALQHHGRECNTLLRTEAVYAFLQPQGKVATTCTAVQQVTGHHH